MADTAVAEEVQAQETPQEDGSVAIHEAQLSEAAPRTGGPPGGQIDILLNTSMSLEARLGQAEMTAGQLLQLGPGAVVKLDRLAGEPVDLLLDDTKFATGTLVVVGDRLGVRITEILSAPTEEDSQRPAPA